MTPGGWGRLVVGAVGVASLMAVLSLMSVVATRAGAATGILEVGWWTSSPTASAPDGGIAVGSAPTGPTSVAAMRLDLGGGVTAAVLTLEEVGGVAREVADLQVCRGDDDWTAAAGGGFGDAPAGRCGNAPLRLTPDGTTWTVDLMPIVGSLTGATTIVVVPLQSGDVGGVLGLGYEVQFDPPVLFAAEPPAPPVRNPNFQAPTPAPAPAAVAPPAVAPPVVGSPGVAQTAPAPAAPTTETSVTTTTVGDESLLALPIDSTGAPGPPWGRLGVILPIAAAIGIVAGYGRRFALARLG